MRYFFRSKIEVRENGGFIHIPFNVWEVCKQREVIKADIVLDNDIIIQCELLPVDKGGNYMVHLAYEEMEGIALTVEHRVLLNVNGSLIKISQDSPYSVENPIRDIGEGIELIKQPNDGLCGQAVVAMLAGVSIQEVMDVMECREWQGTMGRMISALNYYGIDHSEIIYYTERPDGQIPECCIIMEKLGRFSHYLIHYKGKFYDPTLGLLDEYDKSKLLGYLEIRY